MQIRSEHRCFGGTQGFYEHDSEACGGPMRFGVYLPPRASATTPVVYYLAGLECNEQTFAMKAGAQRLAAELGLALLTPDTSPRATRFPGDDASWDFGQAASFYLDATAEPWSAAYRMRTYITAELRTLVETSFPVSRTVRGVMGHSMGGHGALTLALKHADLYRAVSAIAPICAPSRVPWGEKAFTGYLGSDRTTWAEHDATALVEGGKRVSTIRIDQGMDDKFLKTQLLPDVFETTCIEAGQPLELHLHEGYDHGYYFISTVIEAQLRHQARGLRA